LINFAGHFCKKPIARKEKAPISRSLKNGPGRIRTYDQADIISIPIGI